MGGKLEGDFGCKLEGDSSSKFEGDFGSKLEGDSGSKLEGDSGSKHEGDFGSKLEGESCSKLDLSSDVIMVTISNGLSLKTKIRQYVICYHSQFQMGALNLQVNLRSKLDRSKLEQ